ncbi:probable pectate lyase 1 [Vitis vinifera]|uniref:probable pectate lyase 1 n=1 Tax=Vitis vinifera TaxID=29760 RepID=UPI00053F698A|nr:probable pectate lyase 1 [Vitis vinifera]|eukprot:XP_010646559.1 PREDICTED: probable pectate lyase 1 [Vitis vinifera]
MYFNSNHIPVAIVVVPRMLPNTCILPLCLLWSLSSLIRATLNLDIPFPHQHPNPEVVVDEESDGLSCLTGNPVDDCWRCDPNWQNNQLRLTNCGIGFGQDAMSGKGGQFYVVIDSFDEDPINPTLGTFQHAVIQTQPLCITFSTSMLIKLKHELIVNSFKTIIKQ